MFMYIRYFGHHPTVGPTPPPVRYRRLSACLAAAFAFLPLIG
jgi:hypothetical protein